MNIFEKNRKTTIFIVLIFILFLFILIAELVLEKFIGLGKPVLYNSSAIYGYRPLENRAYERFFGKKIKFNNLALRSSKDWDKKKSNKILFLGDSVTYGGSYIDNSELFSEISVKLLNKELKTDFISGNAGVNAWGVENVYALVVETNFTPAKYYVSLFPEGDFYRGLSRISGMPFFNISPKYALEELWLYFCWKQNNKRYQNWQKYALPKELEQVVYKATFKLKTMDKFLKQDGYKHIIFITPTKEELLNNKPIDKLVKESFDFYHLKVIYLLDRLKKLKLSKEEINKIYHDNIHLTSYGHKIWAKIISKELIKLLRKKR